MMIARFLEIILMALAVIGTPVVIYKIWTGKKLDPEFAKRRMELRRRLSETHGELDNVELERQVREEEKRLDKERGKFK